MTNLRFVTELTIGMLLAFAIYFTACTTVYPEVECTAQTKRKCTLMPKQKPATPIVPEHQVEAVLEEIEAAFEPPTVRNRFQTIRVTNSPVGVTRTKQYMAEQCDINNIIKRYQASGQVNHLASGKPSYGDFSQSSDYFDAVSKVSAAHDDFDKLPSAIRAFVNNDPGMFLALCENPDNAKIMANIGLTELYEELHGPLPKPTEPTAVATQTPAPAAPPAPSEPKPDTPT